MNAHNEEENICMKLLNIIFENNKKQSNIELIIESCLVSKNSLLHLELTSIMTGNVKNVHLLQWRSIDTVYASF